MYVKSIAPEAWAWALSALRADTDMWMLMAASATADLGMAVLMLALLFVVAAGCWLYVPPSPGRNVLGVVALAILFGVGCGTGELRTVMQYRQGIGLQRMAAVLDPVPERRTSDGLPLCPLCSQGVRGTE